jgi:dTDP-4-amino-4,6-dideoxygalactose transaminase
MSELEVAGVPTRPYFSPIHLQPFYRERFGYAPGDFPMTEALGETCLALPFCGTMARADVERVCRELAAAVQKHAGQAVPVLSRSL